jgi:GntR family transcriptional regulator/MocR family aminotransferase
VNLAVDKSSAEPAYEQISRQIEELVRQGLLGPGARIPSIRQLAQRLGLANSTVAIAYDELAARRVIETRRGSGTFIAGEVDAPRKIDLSRGAGDGAAHDARPMNWEKYFFGSDFFGMPVGAKNQKLIRFTQASPDPALFPLERIKQVSASMLWTPQAFFFDRANPQGYQPLVEHIEKEMALAGVPMAAGQNDVILTGGFQRALSLLIDYLIRDGQKVAIEAPCFTQLLNLLIAKRVGYVPIPVDGQGMDTEYLAGVLARGEVQAVITIPTFHNPTGVCMSRERREHLLRLAEQYRVPVIEDDWGRLLRYEGEDDRPLKALDEGWYVIHIGSYSKCLLPGLRIGWITCPSAVAQQLVCAKLGADNSDSQFLQVLLHNFIEGSHFHRHIRHTVKQYRKRRDAMCDTLARCLPSGCRYRQPQGGFSVWLELPSHLRSMPLLKMARERGVDFFPAAFMMPDRYDTNALRLCFSRLKEEDIQRGTQVLCEVIADAMNNPGLLQGGFQQYEDLFI